MQSKINKEIKKNLIKKKEVDKIGGECNQHSFEKRVSVDWKVPGGTLSNREDREVLKQTNKQTSLRSEYQLPIRKGIF